MVARPIPLNSPTTTGREIDFIRQAIEQRVLAGDGRFTDLCHDWIRAATGTHKALLTHSCTAALEMAALLLDISGGDEVIMPSHTFVSTANAFVLRGGVPVFVDVRRDTLNIDETLIEAAITPRTRAIAVVHYAGIACDMDAVAAIAARHRLALVEDAAQGLGSAYKGKPLGAIGDLGAFSFHETKNIMSGEGGALLVNRPDLAARAEIIREKGTDRSRFFRNEVDKYTWQDIGSSYLPSEIVAAFLWAQLQDSGQITGARRVAWQTYHDALENLEQRGLLIRPTVPEGCTQNGHIYYILLPTGAARPAVIAALREFGVGSAFHYVPLHSSPAGLRFGRVSGSMAVTDDATSRLIRLPMWWGITPEDQARVVDALDNILGERI
jgi:dTDP-4-amino-4,6-dideoxygalactose transaminase